MRVVLGREIPRNKVRVVKISNRRGIYAGSNIRATVSS